MCVDETFPGMPMVGVLMITSVAQHSIHVYMYTTMYVHETISTSSHGTLAMIRSEAQHSRTYIIHFYTCTMCTPTPHVPYGHDISIT